MPVFSRPTLLQRRQAWLSWARRPDAGGRTRVACPSPALLSHPTLRAVPHIQPVWAPWGVARGVEAVLGWEGGPSAPLAAFLAKQHALPTMRASAGLLGSAAPGQVPAQIMLDTTGGSPDDPAQASCIDAALAEADTPAVRTRAAALIEEIRAHGMSHAHHPQPTALPDRPFVLILDQAPGDPALPGNAQRLFRIMLDVVRTTWPDHLVVVRGDGAPRDTRYKGLCAAKPTPALWILPGDDAPTPWLRAAAHVVTLSSPLGLEALIHATPLTCWATPFYAARGLTRDLGRQPGYVRPSADLVQLVGASLLVAPFSTNPATQGPGSPEQIMAHMRAVRRAVAQDPAQAIALGFPKTATPRLRAMMPATQWVGAKQARRHPEVAVVAWADTPVPKAWKDRPVVRVQEAPMPQPHAPSTQPVWSWWVDHTGALPTQPEAPSDVERAVAGYTGTPEQQAAVASLRARLNAPHTSALRLPFAKGSKTVVLVVGQSSSPPSVRPGRVRSNTQLLTEARQHWPNAFLVYLPDPKALAGRSPSRWRKEARLADLVALNTSAEALLQAVDRVAVISSPVGFQALVRGLPVTCFGTPFYAGWGLTEDRDPDWATRAHRRPPRPLDALLWGALVEGARYASPATGALLEAPAALDLHHSLPAPTPRRTRWRPWRRRSQAQTASSAHP